MAQVFVTGGSGFVGGYLIRALVAQGDTVRALARSERAATIVTAAGAEPVRGDLADDRALRHGMDGCRLVFHLAANVDYWGDPVVFYETNVTGTEKVLAAARQAGVDRLVHLSTESVLLGAGGEPVERADESHPRPRQPFPFYPHTKGLAEDRVLAANDDAFAALIVRPRFIWGPHDTSLLAKLVEAVRDGRFWWVDGGRHLTSTVHVDNLTGGMLLAAERGRGGEVYHMTDGEPVTLRTFWTTRMRSLGVEPPNRSLPYGLAYAIGSAVEWVWSRFKLPGLPPMTRYAVALLGRTVTLDDSKARRELGYRQNVSVKEALASLPATTP